MRQMIRWNAMQTAMGIAGKSLVSWSLNRLHISTSRAWLSVRVGAKRRSHSLRPRGLEPNALMSGLPDSSHWAKARSLFSLEREGGRAPSVGCLTSTKALHSATWKDCTPPSDRTGVARTEAATERRKESR